MEPNQTPTMPASPMTAPNFSAISRDLNAPPVPTPEKPSVMPLPELPKPPVSLPPPHKTSWGPFFGIVIIVLVLIIGALYFWGEQLDKQHSSLPASAETTP